MERLEEVLIRIRGITSEDAYSEVSKIRHLIESGVSPIEVLVDEYGLSTEYLEKILSPKETPQNYG